MQPIIPATETGTSPDTRIIEAAKNGNIDQIRALIAEQVDLNARDREDNTALHLASEKGHTEIVKALLTGEGIDINARENYEWTPLHYAARNGHIEVVEVLLKNGAQVDLVSDEHDTPLHFAARNGHIEVVEVLLKNGANIEAEGTYYNQSLGIDFILTPLHYAAEWGQAKVVELLLKNGACVSKMAVGDKDYSAMEWVLSKNKNNLNLEDEKQEEIINILFKYGANISPELLREITEDDNISDTTKELVTELSQPERILARDEALREDPDLIEDYKNFILNGKLTLDSANTLVLYNESFGDLIVKAINSITKEELKEIKETDPEKFKKIRQSGFGELGLGESGASPITERRGITKAESIKKVEEWLNSLQNLTPSTAPKTHSEAILSESERLEKKAKISNDAGKSGR